MTRTMVAILSVYGLMGAMVSAQAQDNLSALPVDAVPDYSASDGLDKGAGLHFGPLRVSPELSVSYFHDSNPTYVENGAKAVNGIRAEPSLNLLLTGNGWDAYARVWVDKNWYLGSTTNKDLLDKDYYGESAGFNLETPQGNRFSLNESFDFQNRSSYVAGSTPSGTYNASWQDRYFFTLGSMLDLRLGEKTGMSVGGSYSDLWYENPILYGMQDAGATLGFNRKLTEKSNILIDFGADNQWSDGSSGESQSYRALVGVGSQPTAKSSYRAEVGIMGYSFNNGADTAFGPTYNLSGNWRVSQRLSAHVSGSASYQPSETDQNNYTLVDTIGAGLTFEATSRLTTSLDAVYRREDYAKTDMGADEKRLDNLVDLNGRVSYRLFRYTSVFVGADFGRNTSTIMDESYNRLFLETGMDVRF